ncbi:MAG: hypothetical protein JO044_06215 [Mycobacteriaceae bacterium]|nr:hypothetical protein [Mycobacteriaceae bacterium]MBV9638428.1 hypothetical protein [Mycobacteriaceae bacterium]
MSGHRSAVLAAAAFGDDPGRWPLPAAETSRDLWLRAVAAGGQGRYGGAHADLAALRRRVDAGPLASLAHSTCGSFLRQLGGHAGARRWDGQALALAGSDPEAAVDALIGLAADALGMGRLAASAALLARAALLLDRPGLPDRLSLRWHWVAAERAMVAGEGAEAVRHADHAAELAADSRSARHRAKTAVVRAAALCSVGQVDLARTVADDALITTGRLGLIPLRWAAAGLLADIESNIRDAADVLAIRDACARTVRHGGGVWSR